MMEDIEVAISTTSKDVLLPVYALPECAGMDLQSQQNVEILPGRRAVIRTGLKMKIPEGFYRRIASRSGLAADQGIVVAAGVIDSSFRGEIVVIVFNHGHSTLWIYPGLKIAQIMIEKHYQAVLKVVDNLPADTERGEKGLGSTDKCTD